ncbi:MAG: hypothetical protein J6V87_00835 [Prevotella sp.]|nr:hypothetical protein [Prevotella sp.]
MRKFMMLLLWLVASTAMAQSKVYDKLILMDGSMVEGRITVQHPGKDLVFVQEEQETVYPMEDILAIERSQRSNDDLSGIDDVIETRGGKIYKGQIVKQLLGKSVYLREDHGVVQIIKNEEIACQKKEKLNQEQSLFEQTPFLDVVITPDGTWQGVIVLQDYGSDEEASFLCVEDSDGQQQKVEIAAITEMQRIPNDSYAPIKEFVVGDDEVFFNRNLAMAAKYTNDKNTDFRIKRETLQAPVITFSPEEPLVIEVQDVADYQQGALVRATVQDTGKKEALVFSYQDLVISPIKPVLTTTVKNTLRREYQVLPGYYVFFVPQGKKVYVCEVK